MEEAMNKAQMDRPLRTLAGEKLADRAERAKHWDECGIEEKVERIRRELLNQRDVARHALRQANEAHSTAHEHQHGSHGEVLKPVNRGYGLQAEGCASGFDPLR